jgi:hypothetical protein
MEDMLSFLQAAFYVVAAMGSAYFLIRRRTFDFFTIGFASSLVYFLPGFFGFVRSSSDFTVAEQLQPGTYVVFISVMAGILAGAYLFDQLVNANRQIVDRHVSLTLTTETALVIASLALVATVLASGADLFSARKSEVIESVGRWHVLFRFASIYVVAFAVIRRQMLFAAAGTALLLFDLFVGFRLGLVIGMLAAATLVLNSKGVHSLLRSEKRNLILGVVFIVAVFLYKRIYIVIKLGLWDTVVARLTSPDISFLALMGSEPFGTQTVLNEVIRTGFTVDPSHLGSVAALLVPFSNLLGAEIQSFNDLFQQELFGGVARGGLANNIWAQMYAIGGWMGIGIIVPIYVALLALGSWLLTNSRGASLALVAVAFSFIAFYLHRNDVLFMLVLLRRCLMVWFILIIPALLLVDARRADWSGNAGQSRP